MARQKKSVGFEQSLNELQALVERLESVDLSLEESLSTFEQFIGVTRESQSTLLEAEQLVQVILEQNGTLILIPLDVSTLPLPPTTNGFVKMTWMQRYNNCYKRQAPTLSACTKQCDTAS